MLTLSHQRALVSKQKNSILCCIKKVTSRSREAIPPLCSALRQPHPECCIEFQSPQYKKHMELLEQTQHRATNMIKGLKHI